MRYLFLEYEVSYGDFDPMSTASVFKDVGLSGKCRNCHLFRDSRNNWPLIGVKDNMTYLTCKLLMPLEQT